MFKSILGAISFLTEIGQIVSIKKRVHLLNIIEIGTRRSCNNLSEKCWILAHRKAYGKFTYPVVVILQGSFVL